MKKLILAFSLLFSLAAVAEEKSVDIYSDFGSPGYTSTGSSGERIGFEVDLAEAIFSRQGYQVNWKERSWDGIVADLATPSHDKSYLYLAAIERTPERRKNWLFGSAVEFDASHYFFGKAGLALVTGEVLDTKTEKTIPGFLLDVPANRIQGRKLRVAAWKGSVLESELRRVFTNPEHLEILGLNGSPIDWLQAGEADVIYAFASGPKNSYTDLGFATVAGPVSNFDLNPLSGSAPAMPMNDFGQSMDQAWVEGFRKIISDDTFFTISWCWFGRVSWPYEFNRFLLEDEAAFRERIHEFEKSAGVNPPNSCKNR